MEAIFLLRAYRTTLPRFGVSEPMDTSRMRVERRISATWKDLPGGQILGSTFDYTHRLLDRGLAVPGTAPRDVEPERTAEDLAMMAADAQALLQEPLPRAMDALGREGLMESVAPSHEGNDCPDITRQPLELPADGSGDRAVLRITPSRPRAGISAAPSAAPQTPIWTRSSWMTPGRACSSVPIPTIVPGAWPGRAGPGRAALPLPGRRNSREPLGYQS